MRLPAFVLLLVFAGVYIYWRIESDRKFRFDRETRAVMESLHTKRPAEVREDVWDEIVFWTLNAHANCIGFAYGITRRDRGAFLSELRERLDGPVTLATIDWIWDEFVRLTPDGKRYSDMYRPTAPERLRELENTRPPAKVKGID